jgi:PAS domain S-box-containing protein
MRLLRGLAIQQKMLLITLLICSAVLLLATAGLFTFQALNFRDRFQSDNETLATIIANNSTAAMSFGDASTAAEVISALKAKQNVVAALLAATNGVSVAEFGRRAFAEPITEYPPTGQSKFLRGQLLVTEPVTLKGERLGTLYLQSNFRRGATELFWMYSVVVCIVFAASTLLAFFLSGALGRRITGPILALARTAQLVGEKKDYSLRAELSADRDEVARLTESFNEMLGRVQSQDAELSRSRRKMEALINSIDGVVWERAADSFQFTFVSLQTEKLLGYTPEQWINDPNFWEAKLEPTEASKTIKAAQELAGKGKPYTHEYRMIAADGHTVWIRESGTILTENGEAMAVRGIFQDVTRQKHNAEELDKLNKQLVTTSRMAGMAEVATGVLHNVGNVLNSLSVSATLVADGLRNSKVPNLKRAATMLRDQNGHIADYLSTDPKGKLIPEYITTVVDQISTEHTKLASQMTSVGTHIEHIKEIVAMQQSYAKVSGVYENLEIGALVDDALRMNAAAFDRHGIELTRDCEANLPMVTVDRHKVLQILINLLRNAKYAMDQRRDNNKSLTVRVASSNPGFVKITVLDNGIGIAPENLKKIFNHGFTTKRDGHGFGLHSGANAAKEMGGTLAAKSEGVGKGAEFVLELPTTATRAPRPNSITNN